MCVLEAKPRVGPGEFDDFPSRMPSGSGIISHCSAQNFPGNSTSIARSAKEMISLCSQIFVQIKKYTDEELDSGKSLRDLGSAQISGSTVIRTVDHEEVAGGTARYG